MYKQLAQTLHLRRSLIIKSQQNVELSEGPELLSSCCASEDAAHLCSAASRSTLPIKPVLPSRYGRQLTFKFQLQIDLNRIKN